MPAFHTGHIQMGYLISLVYLSTLIAKSGSSSYLRKRCIEKVSFIIIHCQAVDLRI